MGKSACKLADRPQQDVEYQGRQGANLQCPVGIYAEYGFGQKFASKEYNDGADYGLQDQSLDEMCHQYAIYDKGYVVANQYGGDEVAGVFVEDVNDS